MSEPVEIVDYDPRWPETFSTLRDQLAAALGTLAQRIEHVGSTAVPGLPAKPIIDLDVVIATPSDLPAVVSRLHPLGYHHQGDLGVTGRDAFTTPTNAPPHHLYVVAADSPELARHLTFRDYLRSHPGTAHAYAALKRSLARRLRTNRAAYSQGKATFIEQALATAMAAPPPRPTGSPSGANRTVT